MMSQQKFPKRITVTLNLTPNYSRAEAEICAVSHMTGMYSYPSNWRLITCARLLKSIRVSFQVIILFLKRYIHLHKPKGLLQSEAGDRWKDRREMYRRCSDHRLCSHHRCRIKPDGADDTLRGHWGDRGCNCTSKTVIKREERETSANNNQSSAAWLSLSCRWKVMMSYHKDAAFLWNLSFGNILK